MFHNSFVIVAFWGLVSEKELFLTFHAHPEIHEEFDSIFYLYIVWPHPQMGSQAILNFAVSISPFAKEERE